MDGPCVPGARIPVAESFRFIVHIGCEIHWVAVSRHLPLTGVRGSRWLGWKNRPGAVIRSLKTKKMYSLGGTAAGQSQKKPPQNSFSVMREDGQSPVTKLSLWQ